MANAQLAHFRVIQHRNGLNHRIRVEQRFPHAHKNKVINLAPDVRLCS